MASWIGNRELDVIVEAGAFARAMEEQYLMDLAGATGVVVSGRRVRAAGNVEISRIPGGSGSANRAVAGALRVGNAMGAALSPRARYGPAERPLLVPGGLALVAVGLLAAFWPPVVAWPLAALALWNGLALLLRAVRASRTPPPLG